MRPCFFACSSKAVDSVGLRLEELRDPAHDGTQVARHDFETCSKSSGESRSVTSEDGQRTSTASDRCRWATRLPQPSPSGALPSSPSLPAHVRSDDRARRGLGPARRRPRWRRRVVTRSGLLSAATACSDPFGWMCPAAKTTPAMHPESTSVMGMMRTPLPLPALGVSPAIARGRGWVSVAL